MLANEPAEASLLARFEPATSEDGPENSSKILDGPTTIYHDKGENDQMVTQAQESNREEINSNTYNTNKLGLSCAKLSPALLASFKLGLGLAGAWAELGNIENVELKYEVLDSS